MAMKVKNVPMLPMVFLALLSITQRVDAAQIYNISYIEVEECEWGEVAAVFANGWVFICEEYKYPYHYGPAVLIVIHYGYGGARLCLQGGECLKGHIE
jgi:hypothetical protein